MPDTMIDVQDITRTYRTGDVDVHALRGVSFSLERGEFVAIMGSSGSGKSTLMSILGCLDRPTSGHYLLEGVDVATLSEPELAAVRSTRLGVRVPELQSAAPHERHRECRAAAVLFAVRARRARAPRSSARETHCNCSASATASDNTPAQLSGGQQQRVAIARALIN